MEGRTLSHLNSYYSLEKRNSITYPFAIDPLRFIEQNKGCVSFFNSNDKDTFNLLAWGIESELKLNEEKGAFQKLKDFQIDNMDWMMGYLSYDLKNDVEELKSENKDDLSFPALHFYIPTLLIEIHSDFTKVESISHFHEELLNKMMQGAKKEYVPEANESVNMLIHGLEEDDYLVHFNSLSKHIQQGDIYEINYCLDFNASNIKIDPISTYYKLNQQTEAPFSVFYRNDEHYLLCGSPERFLKKEGSLISSQPIKGTIKRGKNRKEDELLKKQLRNDPKEQAENVMIVDLVRNDLSRIAAKASVKVDELFGVYSFKTVHQLISTVSCEAKEGLHPVDIIKAAYPMGSMTGAPKIRAMQLIEENERFKRGIYSGAFGYFTPAGDFDFNVVIRSIIYNEKNKKVSFPVGGAITSLANGADEYRECILKAKAMKKALQNS